MILSQMRKIFAAVLWRVFMWIRCMIPGMVKVPGSTVRKSQVEIPVQRRLWKCWRKGAFSKVLEKERKCFGWSFQLRGWVSELRLFLLSGGLSSLGSALSGVIVSMDFFEDGSDLRPLALVVAGTNLASGLVLLCFGWITDAFNRRRLQAWLMFGLFLLALFISGALYWGLSKGLLFAMLIFVTALEKMGQVLSAAILPEMLPSTKEGSENVPLKNAKFTGKVLSLLGNSVGTAIGGIFIGASALVYATLNTVNAVSYLPLLLLMLVFAGNQSTKKRGDGERSTGLRVAWRHLRGLPTSMKIFYTVQVMTIACCGFRVFIPATGDAKFLSTSVIASLYFVQSLGAGVAGLFFPHSERIKVRLIQGEWWVRDVAISYCVPLWYGLHLLLSKVRDVLGYLQVPILLWIARGLLDRKTYRSYALRQRSWGKHVGVHPQETTPTSIDGWLEMPFREAAASLALQRTPAEMQALLWALVACAMTMLFGFASTSTMALTALFCAAFAIIVATVISEELIQRVPEEIRGGVSSITVTGNCVFLPVSNLLACAMFYQFGAQDFMGLMGLTGVIALLLSLRLGFGKVLTSLLSVSVIFVAFRLTTI